MAIGRNCGVVGLVAMLLMAACNQPKDYLTVVGGGFVFNYRIAEATYGIALRPERELPNGSVIEATLENPAGGAPFVIANEGPFNRVRIPFQTPPVSGVVKDRPYKVVVVLRNAAGATLQTIEKTYASELDQTVLPERPLVIGPGYHKNLDRSTTAYPPALSRNSPARPSR